MLFVGRTSSVKLNVGPGSFIDGHAVREVFYWQLCNLWGRTLTAILHLLPYISGRSTFRGAVYWRSCTLSGRTQAVIVNVRPNNGGHALYGPYIDGHAPRRTVYWWPCSSRDRILTVIRLVKPFFGVYALYGSVYWQPCSSFICGQALRQAVLSIMHHLTAPLWLP